MPHRRRLTPCPSLAHDYELEPPDEVIAELQYNVVQSRQRGSRSRDELLGELAITTRTLGDGADAHVFMQIAALTVLLRMAGAA